ncbi:MAG TPA: hypothetical protein VFM40_04440 [Actinomycetota bacterium]|nr:hypothetical protein [Actinomycetota bacterium]
MTRTVHLVYPSGPAISCPDAIGRNLAERLRRRYSVVQYDWDAIGIARPGPDDVLVGHPHPVPGTLFRRSCRVSGWRRVIALAPFVSNPMFVGFHEPVIRRYDLFLAITGAYWYRMAPTSAVNHWCPKLVHVDLAVDRRDFPRVKGRFAPPGRRRFLYVGHTAPWKNVGYLSAIARRMPQGDVGWIGSGTPIAGVVPLGPQDFRTESARRIVADFDFLLTVGRVDANPATILEAMSWGLIPVCTPTSGYSQEPGIANVPLDDLDGAVQVVSELQRAPEAELEHMRADNDAALARHYNWDRLAQQVVDAIESSASPTVWRISPARRTSLLKEVLMGPSSPVRPTVLWRVAAATARTLAHPERSGPPA